jgi:hypothetical protein
MGNKISKTDYYAMKGNLDSLKSLSSLKITKHTLFYAVTNGHYNTVKWLCDNNTFNKLTLNRALNISMINCHKQTTKYLLNKYF